MHVLVGCVFGRYAGFVVVWTDLAALRYDIGYCKDIEDYSAIAWTVVG